MAEVVLKRLPPEEAIAYFRSKGFLASFAWQDVWQEEHARAFTVAKAMQRTVLEEIRAAVDRAIAEGRTFEQFRSELQPELERLGWWGRAEMEDPLTGETREVQLGSSRRLRTIFDVNLRTAHAAGRWQRIEQTRDALPYLRYVAVMDDRTRPEHRAWHGTILRADHPWWDTHYPPCGWRCRCTTVQLSLRTIERRGWQVTETPIAFEPRAYTNPRTGEVTTVERGIDPGFSYNVGKAWMGRTAPRLLPGDGDGRAPASVWPDQAGEIEAFLAGFGATLEKDVVFETRTGDRLPIGRTLFETSAGEPSPLLPDDLVALPAVGRTIREPDEAAWIWRAIDGEPDQLMRRFRRRDQAGRRDVQVQVDLAVGGSAPAWRFTVAAA